MKKGITVLMALTLVFGFAGFASAASVQISDYISAVNCAGDGANIRTPGCDDPGEQESRACGSFDFEYDRCTGKQANQAIFPICDCVSEGYFDSVTTNQEYGISMKILVDRHDGQGITDNDNFVYWADQGDVDDNGFDLADGIDVGVYEREADACQTTLVGYMNEYNGTPIRTGSFGNSFDDFNFELANGTAGTPDTCAVTNGNGNDSWRVTYLELDSSVPGFVTTTGDSTNWVVDIPDMWADFPNAQPGWTVYVEVSFIQRGNADQAVNICQDCNCKFLLEVGTLCCNTAPTSCADTLTFPYFPSKDNFWLGMAITNKGSEDGTATITIYETNGETATITADVAANSTKIITDFSANTSGGAVQSWAQAVCDFPASGFAMFGQVGAGDESLGYIAERCGNCSSCSH